MRRTFGCGMCVFFCTPLTRSWPAAEEVQDTLEKSVLLNVSGEHLRAWYPDWSEDSIKMFIKFYKQFDAIKEKQRAPQVDSTVTEIENRLALMLGKSASTAYARAVTSRKQELPVGARVFHEKHGLGRLMEVDFDNASGKPYFVTFDGGDSHHYSASSMRKLEVVEAGAKVQKQESKRGIIPRQPLGVGQAPARLADRAETADEGQIRNSESMEHDLLLVALC